MSGGRVSEISTPTPEGAAVLCSLLHDVEELPSRLLLSSDYHRDVGEVRSRPHRVAKVTEQHQSKLQHFLDYLARGNGGAGKAAIAHLDSERRQRVFLPPQQLANGQVRLHSSWFAPAEAPSAATTLRIDPNALRKATVNAQALARGVKLEADQEAARRHYDTLQRDRRTRHESYILHLRNLNNFLKASLIQLASRQETGALRVLDLACGKGGDLQKWLKLKPSVYTGIDIAKKSLEDLVERYESIQNAGLAVVTLGCCDLGHDRLVPTKISAEQSISKLRTWNPDEGWHEGYPIPPRVQYSIASMQFALHYAFETSSRARQLLQEISALLKPGGVFVATTVDARVLTSELLSNGKHVGQSRIVEIADAYDRVVCVVTADGDTWRRLILPGHGLDPNGRDDEDEEEDDGGGGGGGAGRSELDEAMEMDEPTRLESFMGLRYTFELRDQPSDGAHAAVNAPEWLVPLPALEMIAAEADLEIVRAANFSEFFGEAFQDKSLRELMNAMDVLDWRYSISDCTWRLARLYMALELRKRG